MNRITLGEMRANEGPRLLMVYCVTSNAPIRSSSAPVSGLITSGCRNLEPKSPARCAADREPTSRHSSRNRAWALAKKRSRRGSGHHHPPTWQTIPFSELFFWCPRRRLSRHAVAIVIRFQIRCNATSPRSERSDVCSGQAFSSASPPALRLG